ncbi:transthyretin-like family protein [Tuwongella immobilis]|uniref:Carboxypeptidase regulatory-like domain-containing protein n=1 Tax=Tuwongella immobilis TaxID=692036 RepID=A0A6C2YTP0_9BACT|nr:hypothetical protein [Tuwongella immobilis]VIP04252.1 Uncharacterized protein OS=Singulisphaera acidiphila (strain ATCC BAA-1392 / DSM 18658 / VKM B-2454 / MOB10) GN=Sinac_3117 PE=4 SV=1 [Tuwongella immobilis]VTS05867.1 Uncharacterized protein OS=Singulisphaera acidiphila (strain ATCC BAA-1392 / DSM 18658 / VKM B-2454 / MOB10) GN=Sinac_3117 PE=4 SV=1 [Tuwongella immobilis]
MRLAHGRIRWLGMLGIGVVWLGMVGCGESGPKKVPVSGRVTVNGQPAAMVRVQFLHEDSTLPGNLKMPVGLTDEQGNFALSTDGDKDGAVAGEYRITLEWLSGNSLSAYDKLAGRFANPQSTQFRATVGNAATTVPPLELTLPESAILTQPPRTR